MGTFIDRKDRKMMSIGMFQCFLRNLWEMAD